MQQDPNLQAQFIRGQPDIPQGNPYGAYQPNPQMGGYPQQQPGYNPYGGNQNQYQPVGQPGYPNQYIPPVVVGTDQLVAMNSQSTAHSIESRIISGFCCYSCLVYFELIISIISFIFGCVNSLDVGYIILSLITSGLMIVACIMALMAKSSFDSKKQFSAFVLFIIATILNIATTIVVMLALQEIYEDWCENFYPYYYNYDCSDIFADFNTITALFEIPFQFLIGLALICNAHTLVKLMREREGLLANGATQNIGGAGFPAYNN